MTPKLLLIADDDEDNRVVFSATLTHHGYDVSLAKNGEEAIEQARRHAPDLILMDLEMPVLDGREATRRLKEDPKTGSIPIVAVTAQDASRDSLEGAGFCAYVRKPVAPLDLVKIVELCLESGSEQKRWIDLPLLGGTFTPGS